MRKDEETINRLTTYCLIYISKYYLIFIYRLTDKNLEYIIVTIIDKLFDKNWYQSQEWVDT